MSDTVRDRTARRETRGHPGVAGHGSARDAYGGRWTPLVTGPVVTRTAGDVAGCDRYLSGSVPSVTKTERKTRRRRGPIPWGR